MAAVYAAADEVLGREVAIKILGEAVGADEDARRRFTREARAAARVSDHPNVVTIFDIAETDDEPPAAFIVMELLTGGTVADRLKAGTPIPHTQALRWLDETARALDAAHASGMVHRDVKPANLLLDGQGTLKVGDFGIATIASEAPLTQTGQVVGTAAYFSPEQALGKPATAASDRYALAVVAYELLTGRRPFPAATPAAQALAHVDTDPPAASMAAPELPSAVDGVLTRGLAKDPEQRP
ncbi:MAG: serine/threonine protein kinase, partial [Solirubrobacteraceae bacterium]|nr:serine/threonine protein kinase [Solirubrobacteraceae bacterium]